MERTFAWRQRVGVVRVQREQGCAVLKGDPRAGNDQPGTEPCKKAVDEGARIALLVHSREVDGVMESGDLPEVRRSHRAVLIDEASAVIGVGLGQQLGDGHVVRPWVCDVLHAVREGQPHRLDLMVIGLDRLGTHALDVHALDDVHCNQRDESLTVWWALPAGDAVVIRGDRLVPGGCIVGQVLCGHPPAQLLDVAGDLLGDGALVERVRASLCDAAKHLCQIGHVKDIALSGGIAVQQQLIA